MSQPKSTLGRVVTIIKLVLLVAAVVFLYFSVAWYDYATLDDGSEKGRDVRVVSVDEQAQTLSYLDRESGEPVTVPLSDVKFKEGPGEQRDIRPGVRTVLQTARLGLVALALLVFLPVWFLNAERLRVMLGIQSVSLSYWASAKLTWIGNFYNFALPGSTGGDVIKAWYLTEYTHQKTEAVTTILLDRIMGLIGNVLLATIMLTIMIAAGGAYLEFLVIPAVLGGGVIGMAVLATSDWLRRFLRLQAIAERLPFSEQFQRIGASIIALGKSPGRVGLAVLITLVLQAFVYGSLIIMSRALGMEGSLLHYMAFIPIGFMVQALPLAPQGLGLMEGAFIAFFAAPALPNEPSQAVTLALSARLTQLFWALPGAILPLLSGGHRPTGSELHAFEEELEEALEEEFSDESPEPAS
jgi:uncharacterized protein (TIRG00374 family)